MQILNDLIKSNLDCAFQTIIGNANTMKNNIISHSYSHKLYTHPTEKHYAKKSFDAVTQRKKTNNLIIPISKTTPSHTEIRQTEERIATLIQNSNIDATIQRPLIEAILSLISKKITLIS